MKILFAIALCLALVGTAHAQTTLQIRLAEDHPASGLTEATVAHSPTKVYLHPATVITNADVSDAHVRRGNGSTFNVAISFTQQGSIKIADATQQHMDKPLAILVNGEVVAAPIVRSTIRQNAILNGEWTRQEAEDIVKSLTNK
jgi:preprotein translocase subunit SecD